VGLAALGRLALLEGRYEDALAFGERAVAVGRATGMPYLASLTLACFGGSLAEASPHLRERALVLHAEAAAVMKMPSGDFFGADCYAELGGVALATGDLPRARELFQLGLDSPNAMSRLGRPRLLAGLAGVALAEGRLDDAKAHVEEARAFAEERNMRPDLAWIRFVEGRVAEARGDQSRATVLFEQAAALGRALGFKPLVARARAAVQRGSADALIAEMSGAIHDAELRAGFESAARAWA
jgi:tetratricopeptide (TPR) repeat protein